MNQIRFLGNTAFPDAGNRHRPYPATRMRSGRNDQICLRTLGLFLISMLLFSCEHEELEMLGPSVYFADNIDYYVIDREEPPASYSIKGSMSAEGYIVGLTLGDVALNEEEIGALQTRYMIDFPVSFENSAEPFDIRFSCTDSRMATAEKTFHFVLSGPVETYTVTLGAQNNSNDGFYFSFRDRKVHSVSEFEALANAEEGFCLGYDQVNEELLFLSPTELTTRGITEVKGDHVTSFCEIVSVDNQPFTLSSFNGITNDAFMMNLNGADYRTFPYNAVSADKFYLLKSDSGLRGLVSVKDVQKGIAGSVEVVIKLQER